MRSILYDIGILYCLGCNLLHHSDEFIKRLLALRFSGLNHDALMEQQGEVYCRCMIAVIEQTLGNVECCDSRRLVGKAVEHEFVLANALNRQIILIFQRLLHIVGIEHSKRTYHLHILTTESEDIGIGTQQHAKVAKEVRNIACRLFIGINVELAVGILLYLWIG